MIGRNAPKGHGGLVSRTIGAAIMGTVGFYISVIVANLTADVEMSPAETLQSMFPAREPIIVAIVVVTSAVAFLAIAKSGLYRAIVANGVEGWVAICPITIFALIIFRAITIDPLYSPIHYDTAWDPKIYVGMIWSPMILLSYLIDGVLLFAISMRLAKDIA